MEEFIILFPIFQAKGDLNDTRNSEYTFHVDTANH